MSLLSSYEHPRFSEKAKADTTSVRSYTLPLDTCGTLQFTYAAASTPVIAQVTPRVASNGSLITISGSNLVSAPGAEVSVMLGEDLTCVVLTNNVTQIQCTVAGIAKPGIRRVEVLVQGYGLSLSIFPSNTILWEGDVLSTQGTSGSILGGSILNISGLNLDNFSEIRVGNTPCRIMEVNHDWDDSFLCVTDPMVDDGYSAVILQGRPGGYWTFQSAPGHGARLVEPNIGVAWFFNATYINGQPDLVDGISSNGINTAAMIIPGMSLEIGFALATEIDPSLLPIVELVLDNGITVEFWVKVSTPLTPAYQLVASSLNDEVDTGFLLFASSCGTWELWILGAPIGGSSGTTGIFPCQQSTLSQCLPCLGNTTITQGSFVPEERVAYWTVLTGPKVNYDSFDLVTFLFSGTNIVWHMNAQMIFEEVECLACEPGSTTLCMGGGQCYGNASNLVFSGAIDELAIYLYALSAQDITSHYLWGTSPLQPIWAYQTTSDPATVGMAFLDGQGLASMFDPFPGLSLSSGDSSALLVYSSCLYQSPESGLGKCAFNFSIDSTPVVQSFSFQDLNSTGSLLVNITGKNLNGSQVSVVFGQVDCTNVTAGFPTGENIWCILWPLPAGAYPLRVSVEPLGLASNAFDAVLYLDAGILSVSPAVGGLGGGTTLTIVGWGFDSTDNGTSLNAVLLGDQSCLIVWSNATMIECVTQGISTFPLSNVVSITSANGSVYCNSSITFDFEPYDTPIIRALLTQNGSAGDSLILIADAPLAFAVNGTIEDVTMSLGEFDCPVSDLSTICLLTLACTVPDIPAGHYLVSIFIWNYGWSLPSRSYMYTIDLIVSSVTPSQIGFGGMPIQIDGAGFDSVHPGAMDVRICDSVCELLTVTVSRITCLAPPMAWGNASSLVCPITVTLQNTTSMQPLFVVRNLTLTYELSLTPFLLDASAQYGPVDGNQTLILTGTGFDIGSDPECVKVLLGTIPCEVTSVNATVIICVTSSVDAISVGLAVHVFVPGAGYAVSVGDCPFEYSYLDTWPRFAPMQDVFIDSSTAYLVNCSVNDDVYGDIVVGGELVFDDGCDLSFTARSIVVLSTGRMMIGSCRKPQISRVTISLGASASPPQYRPHLNMRHGPTRYWYESQSEDKLFGPGVLAIDGGRLDFFGSGTNMSYSQLATTACAGDTQINVVVPVDWPLGATILMAPSGDASEAEEAVIEALDESRTIVCLSQPLRYAHSAVVLDINGRVIDMRSEVALLTRSIVIQPRLGNSTSNASVQAFTTDTNVSSKIHMNNVAFMNMGQIRFGFHSLLLGTCVGCRVENCVFFGSLNRAIGLLGSSDVLIKGNVIYNSMGHGISLEFRDGAPDPNSNIFEDNLAVGLLYSPYLSPSDRNPAMLWLTTSTSFVIGNAAVAIPNSAFWYELQFDLTAFGSFVSNRAHLIRATGLLIWPVYLSQNHVSTSIAFANLTVYDVGYAAVSMGAMSSQVQLKDFAALNCPVAIHIEQYLATEWGPALVDGGVIVSRGTTIAKQAFAANLSETSIGISIPTSEFVRLDGVTFVNFAGNGSAAVAVGYLTCSAQQQNIAGGFETQLAGMSFIDSSANVAAFARDYVAILFDLDGTVSGVPNASILPVNPLLSSDNCHVVPNVSLGAVPGAICDQHIHRVTFALVQPDSLSLDNLVVANTFGTDLLPYWQSISGYMVSLASNQTLAISWSLAGEEDYRFAYYQTAWTGLSASDRAIIRHEFFSTPQAGFEVNGNALPLSLDPHAQ